MTKREKYISTRNRLAVLALFLLCFLGAKGQDYSGVYYIANAIWNGDHDATNEPQHEYYWYNVNTPEYNWYLVPGADPQLSHYSDAYFNNQYSNTNCGDAADYTGNNYGDPEKPFLTTYRTNRNSNSIWIVKKTADYYYIIHALTGKYVKYERTYKSFVTRKTMHLEDVEGGNPGDVFKYEITENSNSAQSITGFNIRVKNLTSGDRYFNPAGDNWPRYYGTQDGNKKPYSSGMVGVYKSEDNASPLTKGSLWPHEDAKAVLTPTIGELDPSTNTVTITPGFVPVNCQLVYTTDGNDPSPSHGTPYSVPISVTETMTIKAAVIGYGMVLSNVNEKLVVPTLAKPVFTYDCNNGKVSIECTNNASASIFYNMTTDGSEPSDPTNESTPYSGPLTLNNACRIKAVAFYLVAYSDIASLNYSPDYGTVPTISSDDCSADNPQCNIMTVDGLADLSYWYYITTVNGNDNPDVAPDPNEVAYTEFALGSEVILHDLTEGNNGYCTVHFYAVMCGSRLPVSSTVHQLKTSGKPSLTPPSGSNPVLVISGGVFDDKAVITIDMGTPENPIDDITEEVDIVYDGTAEYAIPNGASGTLTVTFKHGNWFTSCEATYEIPAAPAAPTWSQECDNRLSLSTTSPMAVIHYEIGDNDNPPAEPSSSSNTYTEGCLYNIEVGTIVRAKAFEGFRASEEMLADPVDPSSGYYVHHQTHVAAPTFFVNGTEVTIRCATSGASIYYTVSTNNNNNEEEPIADPAAPDPSDPTQLYTTEYTLTGITKIKAIAVKDGMENSCQILVTTREGYSITNVTELNVISGDPDKRSKYWFIENDFNASGYNGPVDFTGVLVGNYHTISGLTKPLFSETSNNAVVRDLNLKSVNIPNTTSGNVGAIVCTAKGNTRIYNCGILPTTADGSSTSQVGGDGKVGGMVGVLQGTARVINCFSYANITGGTHKGGIVGYNDVTTASTQSSVNTMIMNCMFYGEIDTGGEIAPIYGGKKISNSGSTGLNNFNYFRFNSPYVTRESSLKYNCALGARDRYLERFEFFRLILNSNRELASWYIKSTVTGASERVGHWVLDKSIAPYPILKTGEGVYPSIINPDADHAIPIDPDHVHRNEGRKLDELTVYISGVGSGAPTGAEIKSGCSTLTLNVTDKDEANYNFNYKKIQLPYYNEVGTGNYTYNKVVTGWKITAFEGGTPGTFSTENFDYPCYNFVDRACTNKDLYDGDGTDGSDRVFNQGAYYEVPDGVTKITIEPYWANCVYLSDAKYDVTYNGMTACPVSTMGDRPITFNGEQAVYNNIATALSNLTAGTTVYDAAVVLVGNYHHFFNETSLNPTTDSGKPLTIMSADMDNDNEPDNSFFYQHYDRRDVKPLRFDFINIPGIGMAQKEDGKENDPQPGIFHATGWFEITNTVLIHFGQFEFADKTNNAIKPIILHGGIYEQYVSTNNGNATYQYMFVGGNAWFKEFNVGCHTRDGAGKTPKHPVSVAGGEYEKFYLSGRNKPEQAQDAENAECYIDGGKFGEVAGAGMQQIVGNVTWLINGADIQSFFGGGINYDKPITGTITTTIRNSWVDEFCGGPKFGNMSSGMAVTTEAIDCHFGKFFGAGYGGTAYNRKGLVDESQSNNYDDKWNTWVNDHYKRAYNSTYHGVSTSYEYEYFFYSGGRDAKKVGRFYVNFASLSLASTQDVTSTLMGCTIGDFYGGGKYGSVNGDVVSTLTDCTVTGDAFGSGYSAAVPTVEVTNRENSSGTVGFETKPYYNNTANVFNDDKVSPPVPTVTYTWKHANSVTTGNEFDEEGGHFILTTENLDNLGAVLGNATLTINGNTVVKGDVYGGGAKSSSNTNNGTCTVNINGGTYGVVENNVVTGGNIYGGGMGDLASLATPEDPNHSDLPVTEGIVEVNIGNASQEANNVVIHGSVFGCNNVNGSPTDDVTVHIYKTKHNSNNIVTNTNGGYAIKEVFGGGNQAHYQPTEENKTATVHIHNCDNTIEYVYGGGNAANVGTLDADPDEVGNQPITDNTSVIIDGGRIEWLFGGGNGAGVSNPGANIYGNTSVTYHAGDITYLFGGSNEKGLVDGSKSVSILNDLSCSIDNHIAELYGGNNKAPITGGAGTTLTMPCTSNPCPIDYVFGGSREADISGDVTLTIEGGNYNNVFGGNNISGEINGNVTLNLYGGTINNAFGGNNAGGDINGKITVNMLDQGDCPLVVHNIYGGGNEAAYSPTFTPSSGTARIVPEVNLIHGTVSKKADDTGGNVYGGGLGSSATVDANPVVNVGYDVSMATLVGTLLLPETSLTTANVAVEGNVFGGGEAANVVGSTVINIQKVASSTGISATTIVEGDVYGGGALADVNVTDGALTPGATTTVTLNGGTVGNIYGGGLGRLADNSDPEAPISAVAAKVYGPVQVTVNGGTVTESVYGCNNINGAPQSTVNVDIYGTDTPASDYALGAVFGGGNQAAYSGTPVVKVHNCNNSIEYVYGGGNAASVNATDVTIYGGNTIGNVFGGCYGANVTTGTDVKIYGGTIGAVYGGNNESGSITGDMYVTVNKQTEEGHSSCEMHITEVYGGGNKAASQVGNIAIHCTGTGPTEGIEYVYGGANQADITGDIELTIDEGRVGNVFGGNNNDGSISGSITVNIEKKASPCVWEIGNVFGGGNLAQYSGTPRVYIKNGTVANVYGGGNGDPDDATQEPGQVTGTNVTIGDITESGYCAIVTGNVYGGGNAAKVNGNTLVTYNDDNASSTVGKLFGGGDAAGVTGTATVDMTLGTVTTGIYGGCNSSGNIGGKITVNVNGGTIGSATNLAAPGYTTADVFGGGYGASTTTSGDVEVNINSGDFYGDVYGGSALGSVNTPDGDNTTTVNVLGGTLHSVVTSPSGFSIYNGGNVYGGGLGKKEVPDDPDVEGDQSESAIEAKVYGTVTVNIGSCTPNGADPDEGDHTGNAYSGNATIQGNVYGCNNTYGSPQQNVTVNIYQTAHTQGVDEVGDPGYAIHNVFGGGNEADFRVDEKTTTVNVFGCDNTIERTFGGGNAAATNSVFTDIKGGRIHDVFGGGNGEVSAADIYGDITLGIHGGTIGQSYSISNQNGVVTGGASVVINNTGCGGVQVEDHFMGGNFATVYGELNNVITCEGGMVVKNLYGGCKQADVLKYPSVEDVEAHHYDGTYPDYVIELYDANPTTYASTYAEKFGNVHLTVNGGTYENVYGGSQGTPERGANIEGDVQLDIYGGTITKAIFGGSHIKGSIGGTIIVNVEDKYPDDACALDVSVADVYGGGNQANYPGEGITHDGEYNYPQVNIKNATVKNVFGGALEAEVTGNPQIQLKNKATILGNVYGGGNRGVVNGNPKVILNGKQTN